MGWLSIVGFILGPLGVILLYLGAKHHRREQDDGPVLLAVGTLLVLVGVGLVELAQ